MTFLHLQSKLFHCSWVGMNFFFTGRLYLAANVSHLKDSTSYFCSCTHLLFRYFGGECYVVIIYDSLDVLHAAVTNFNFVSVEYLIKNVGFWEMGIY